MPSDTPTPAEIAAEHRYREQDHGTIEGVAYCWCGWSTKIVNTRKTAIALWSEHVIAALSEHYHLLPKAEVQGPNASGDYIIPVKTKRPQDNPHIRIEPVNPWGERVMHPLAVPQPFRDPDLARGFAAALASAADVAEEQR
ncbi:hypothetical protein SEA_BEARBQ_76 [Gordonia phage BearBQ]|nr:hypothetical protein SEA_BEARBQ_76 [Gordonia phage BearBQ]